MTRHAVSSFSVAWGATQQWLVVGDRYRVVVRTATCTVSFVACLELIFVVDGSPDPHFDTCHWSNEVEIAGTGDWSATPVA